ncbi:MAG: D-glycero-beta-D-manno-heptose 1-phosphate adenylyltransferase [Mariprofundaceae bacterium]|nr:D-glycero-beta-D-manno-heptose 1-phosphate adenylyltransferase [Mariprofundaceae bacterium]
MVSSACTPRPEAQKKLEEWRSQGKRIVFTNGCFDLLHPGHIDYLQKARALGDVLIVGLNDDDSIRRLKGATRPINPLPDRAIMLTALKSVDMVVPFPEDTPLDLIKSLIPDMLVKGGDYEPDSIVGAKEVRENGGKVIVIPFVNGHSSSTLIARIRRLDA